MSKKNLLSGRDKKLQELAESYEAAQKENKPIYLDADDFADLADWYALHSNFPMAHEVVRYGLELHPLNTALLVEQTYLYMDTAQREKAQQTMEQITEDYLPEVKILKAGFLVADGNLDAAEELLDSLDEKDDLANIIDVTYMYLDMGYPEKALDWLELGRGKYDEKEAYIALEADFRYGAGELEEAETLYNELIDRNPYSASYWFGLGRCLFDLQQYDKSIEACDYALISDDEFGQAYLLRGNAFYMLGNLDKAVEDYTAATERKASSQEFLNMFVGLQHEAAGEWKEGVERFEKALEGDIDPSTRYMLYANIGYCLHKMGEQQRALHYFEEAHALQPDAIEPYILEGRMYMEDGDSKKAVKRFAQAVECAPCADTWYEIGECCAEIGHLKYAKVAFERAWEMDPYYKGLNDRLAAICMLLKDKESFDKYNDLSENPFQLEELEKWEEVLKGKDNNELARLMREILNAMRS